MNNIWLKIAELKNKFPIGSKVKVIKTALSPEFAVKLGDKDLIGLVIDYEYSEEMVIMECDVDFDYRLITCLWFLHEHELEVLST